MADMEKEFSRYQKFLEDKADTKALKALADKIAASAKERIAKIDKLLVEEGVEHFFDMNSDPYEHNDLLAGELTQEQASELAALRAELVALHATEGI